MPLYATITDFLLAAGATTNRDQITLTLDDGQAVTMTAVAVNPQELETKLPAPAAHAAPLYLQHRDLPFWSMTLPGGTPYIQLNSVDDAEDKTLAAFGKELRPLLAKAGGAILDLRLNNGGEARKANELLRSMIAFDATGGRLAVLISRMTFSAAQTLATRLDEWTGATFIGEPTGSRPNHYGNERPFKLPHSGLRGTIASGLNQPITAHDDRTAITPDLAIPSRAADYFAGKDPALEAAVKYLHH
jgi:C-terminal processing protease CtpA/Prc